MGRREVEVEYGKTEVEEVAEDGDWSLGRRGVLQIGKFKGHWSTVGRFSLSSSLVIVGNGRSKSTEFIRSTKLCAREGSLRSILLMSARIKLSLDLSPWTTKTVTVPAGLWL